MIQTLSTQQQFLVASLVGGIISVIAIWSYRRSKSDKIPKQWLKVGNVKNIYIYPLKSGHYYELTKAECTKYGLKQINDNPEFSLRDRCFIVFDKQTESNKYCISRTYPKLVLIKTSVVDSKNVTFDAPGMETLHVEIPNAETCVKTYCTMSNNERVETIDCGNAAGNWLQKYLNVDSQLRLGYYQVGFNKRRDMLSVKEWLRYRKVFKLLQAEDLGIYAWLTPYMLMNNNSIEDLNSRLETPALVGQFRPNILIEGAKAYSEDDWEWIKIGDAVFRNVRRCTRCVITTINNETGSYNSSAEPLKTLKTYRQLNTPEQAKLDNGPILGLCIGLRKNGFIKQGDAVYVGC